MNESTPKHLTAPILYPNWTESEKAILRENINLLSYSELAALLPGRTVGAIKRRADLIGAPRNGRMGPIARRSLDEDFFNKQSLISAYWAGFIGADGCIVTRPRRQVMIGIHEKDREHLLRFASDSGYDGNIPCRDRICFLCVCAADKWIADLAAIYNIGPQKTFTLQPPNVSGELALAYSVGFIDGDGCWSVRNDKWHNKALIIVGMKTILEWLRQLWADHGATLGTSKLSFKRNVWRMTLYSSHAESVARLLSEIPVPRLERKWRVARGEAFGQERSTLER